MVVARYDLRLVSLRVPQQPRRSRSLDDADRLEKGIAAVPFARVFGGGSFLLSGQFKVDSSLTL